MVKKGSPNRQPFFNLTGQDRLEFDSEAETKQKKDEAIEKVFRSLQEKISKSKEDDV